MPIFSRLFSIRCLILAVSLSYSSFSAFLLEYCVSSSPPPVLLLFPIHCDAVVPISLSAARSFGGLSVCRPAVVKLIFRKNIRESSLDKIEQAGYTNSSTVTGCRNQGCIEHSRTFFAFIAYGTAIELSSLPNLLITDRTTCNVPPASTVDFSSTSCAASFFVSTLRPR